MSGWVKIHRQILNWEWWDDHNTTRLFIWMLLQANHEPKKWRGILIETGQFVSGRKKMADGTGLSEQQIRSCIARLKSTSDLTSKSTNKYTVYTLENWAKYQLVVENQPANQPANQPTINQQSTTNKNEKKKRRKNNREFIPPSFEEFESYCKEKGYGRIAKKAFEFYDTADWHDSKGNKVRNWKQKCLSVWFTEENSDYEVLWEVSEQEKEDIKRELLAGGR